MFGDRSGDDVRHDQPLIDVTFYDGSAEEPIASFEEPESFPIPETGETVSLGSARLAEPIGADDIEGDDWDVEVTDTYVVREIEYTYLTQHYESADGEEMEGTFVSVDVFVESAPESAR